jgi:hypothetical protein
MQSCRQHVSTFSSEHDVCLDRVEVRKNESTHDDAKREHSAADVLCPVVAEAQMLCWHLLRGTLCTLQ